TGRARGVALGPCAHVVRTVRGTRAPHQGSRTVRVARGRDGAIAKLTVDAKVEPDRSSRAALDFETRRQFSSVMPCARVCLLVTRTSFARTGARAGSAHAQGMPVA